MCPTKFIGRYSSNIMQIVLLTHANMDMVGTRFQLCARNDSAVGPKVQVIYLRMVQRYSSGHIILLNEPAKEKPIFFLSCAANALYVRWRSIVRALGAKTVALIYC